MAITITSENGVLILGPGAVLQASSDLLPLANPPFHWGWDFLAPPEQAAHWLQTSITTNNGPTRLNVLWNDPSTPADLLASIHFQEPVSIDLTVTVQDNAGDRVDGPTTVSIPWNNLIWMHTTQRLWANNIVARVTAAGGGDDRLDQILAAVYRTWPGA